MPVNELEQSVASIANDYDELYDRANQNGVDGEVLNVCFIFSYLHLFILYLFQDCCVYNSK